MRLFATFTFISRQTLLRSQALGRHTAIVFIGHGRQSITIAAMRTRASGPPKVSFRLVA